MGRFFCDFWVSCYISFMQVFSFEIIWTHLSVTLDEEINCDAVFESIKNRLRDFEIKFSRFLEGNWLFNINTNRRWILDTDGKNMLLFALDVAEKTDGYFDPTIGKRLTELWYGNQKFITKNIQTTEWYGDYRDIEMRGDELILHGNVFLEFGWVGKGYLIDIIKEILDIYPRYLINFGWDMYGRWGWKVWLESPFVSDELIWTFLLTDTFLACSAGNKRKWGDHHHLIDPKTWHSSTEVIATFIEGSSGIVSDSYATALSVMPWDRAVDILKKTKYISGVLLRYDGTLFQKWDSQMELFQ